MSWYAETPRRKAGQIASDVAMIAWVAVAAWASRAIGASVRAMAEPIRDIGAATTAVAGDFTDVGDWFARVPGVGQMAQTPMTAASSELEGIAAQAEAQAASIEVLATLLTVIVFLLPVLSALAVWLPARIRFLRQSGSVRAVMASTQGQHLLAWRALARQPLQTLTRLTPDPVGSVRDGDPDTIAALAALEMRAAGVRVPPPAGIKNAPPRGAGH